MRGGTVAVVGGSIAGCAFASAAARAGAGEVVVLERTHGRLADRGLGLCVHNDRAAELAATGALPTGIARHRLDRRRWVVRDAAEPSGRVFWEQPFPFHSYHWGLLWRGLREATPASVVYRQGATVTGVAGVGDQAEVRLAGGAVERCDLVVGADGYRSLVREAVCPESRPHYAGYVCWRGNFDAGRLAAAGDGDWPSEAVTTVCFPGGSCVIYRIPGPDGPRVNWVLYAMPPQSGQLRFDDPTSFPPGKVTGELAACLSELLDREFPPYWARVIALTEPEDTFVQPIYDLETARTTAGRFLLAGDAATVVRPHNTSGAAKALQDASAFEAAWRQAGSWEELLYAYQAARGAAGRELVALARRLGRAQVEQTPAWATMNHMEAQSWWQGQLAGAADIGGQAMTP
ncbi:MULTISPECIES: FAD-dependent monooxygenase [unclassified Streptomyces]|uniref:FAD-dependent monooxygenase n=1 Tax=unclassified Streptomyces TaxID=2593676 RepID=UPI001BE5F227|nr:MULTISPECIES: FAD-dependent monooxygenase [unclassified Streptomyces]MBT2408115.1 monooxygenase [Streptomyces sp. ISL-21]MBT2609565.1 monooxygenase [Streptomyces sp. ISL-87]